MVYSARCNDMFTGQYGIKTYSALRLGNKHHHNCPWMVIWYVSLRHLHVLHTCLSVYIIVVDKVLSIAETGGCLTALRLDVLQFCHWIFHRSVRKR